jgi:hypothetical protein
LRRAAVILAALAIAGASCRHAHKAAPPEPTAGGGQGGGLPPSPRKPGVPASPSGLLSRDATVELQRKLAADGLLGAHREGEIDDPTSAALQKYQARHGLASTGFPDRATLMQLGIDPEKAYAKARAEPPPASGSPPGR